MKQLCLCLMFIFLLGGLAEARTPLLQEGKKTLYQRAVSHPGAQLYASAAADAKVLSNIKTFTVFYIYAEAGNRLEVGTSSTQAAGFIDKASLTVWPQAITMVFTDRMGRMPVLFFKEHDYLVQLCQQDDLGQQLKTLASQAKAGAQDLPILATEPEEQAVSKSRFYLMPVLAVDDQFGDATKILQVASIDPGSGIVSNGTSATSGATAMPQKELKTGIVFVIDTTISMRPYIEQTLKLIRRIYDRLEKTEHGDKVAFAVVAYRNSTTLSPKLEYVAKTVCDFTTVSNRKVLEQALASLDEAKASSHSFSEDAFAGVKTAVEELSWEKYGSKVMLLVSDAGPLAGSDPGSSTKLDAPELADYLRANDIWITALHLKSAGGKANHSLAEKAYQQLSRTADNSSSYIPIDTVDNQKGLAAFDEVGGILAESYEKLVVATAKGQFLQKPMEVKATASPQALAKQIAETTGYAMQLEFLGKKSQTQAPSVVSAWIADADLEHLSRQVQGKPTIAAQPAVLLTKNQLSDLQKQLKIIIENAERTKRTDSKDFFEGILSAAASLTRDPGQFSKKPGENLAQLGVLAEFLDGLPYKSDVLLLREEDWYNKSIGEQTSFINTLKSRIVRYEEYDKDRANWESFGSPNAGDWVYRVPLNMLP